MAPSELSLDVHGTRVRVLCAGSGAPLVYLHGLLGEFSWLPLFESLSREFKLYVPESPGLTETEGLERIESIHDLAFLYADLLDCLELQRPFVAGLSVGGWVAAELAVHYPERASKLVLIDALGLKLPGVFLPDIFAANPSETRALLFRDPNSELALSLLSDTPSPDILTRMLASRQALARVAWNPYLHDPRLKDRLYRVKAPTLILWGDADRLVSPEHGRLYADNITGARMAIIEKSGHLPSLEQPQKTAEHISKFLKHS
jgi:pimeloyl-ACP methyl ester carboxylesterase